MTPGQAAGYFRTLAAAARNANRAVVRVGSPLQYAYGIETGFHRSGRLARRAGGAFYLTRALDQVRPTIAPEVASALEAGPQAVLTTLIRKGFDVERIAKSLVPRVTGTLQRSIQTVYPGRPVEVVALGGRRRVRRVRRPR